MISTSDFKTGLTVEMDGEAWQIMDFQHVKPGKGAAFVRAKLRNVKTGVTKENTFRAGEKVPKARVENKKMQYLYSSGDEYTFMDNETYEQMTLPGSRIENELNYMLENSEVHIIIYKDEVIGIDIPNSVVLTVRETEPGIKGDTATGATKNATMETGLVVQVPLFINEGDKLIIDTRTGSYMSRSN